MLLELETEEAKDNFKEHMVPEDCSSEDEKFYVCVVPGRDLFVNIEN